MITHAIFAMCVFGIGAILWAWGYALEARRFAALAKIEREAVEKIYASQCEFVEEVLRSVKAENRRLRNAITGEKDAPDPKAS